MEYSFKQQVLTAIRLLACLAHLVQSGHEDRLMKALLEVIKEYRKEKENPIKEKDKRIEEANRLLRLEEDKAKALMLHRMKS